MLAGDGDRVRRRASSALRRRAARRSSVHVQPNGVDLSLDAVWRFAGRGSLGRADADRVLPAREELSFDADGWLELEPGTYGIRYAEWVDVPLDCGGLCFPRSSLLRMGVHVPTAVWDAGYAGRGEGLLIVTNPHGVRAAARRAHRPAGAVSSDRAGAATATAGRYQHEGR